MKKLVTLFSLMFLSLSAYSAKYVVIDSQHTHQGCTYYNVTIWDDNGTNQDKSDDVAVGSGTINSCDRDSFAGDPLDDTALVDHEYELEPGCIVYIVIIKNYLFETVGEGVAGTDCD